MTTKEFIKYTKDQEKRYTIMAECTDDLEEKIKAKMKAARARRLHANLERIWGGDRNIHRAVLPM